MLSSTSPFRFGGSGEASTASTSIAIRPSVAKHPGLPKQVVPLSGQTLSGQTQLPLQPAHHPVRFGNLPLSEDVCALVSKKLAKQPAYQASRDLSVLRQTCKDWRRIVDTTFEGFLADTKALRADINHRWEGTPSDYFRISQIKKPLAIVFPLLAKLKRLQELQHLANSPDRNAIDVLGDLAPTLNLEERNVIRATIQSTPDEYKKAKLLTGLSRNPDLNLEELDFICKTVHSRGQESYIWACPLQALAENPNLNPEGRELLRTAIHSFKNSDLDLEKIDKSNMLQALATNPNLNPEERNGIYTTAHTFTDEVYKARILERLAANPNLSQEERQRIRVAIPSLGTDHHKAVILQGLAENPHLSSEEVDFIFAATHSLTDEAEKARVLVSLARTPYLDREKLDYIRTAANSFMTPSEKREALQGLGINASLNPKERDIHAIVHAIGTDYADSEMFAGANLKTLVKNPNLEREERDLIRTTADSFTNKAYTAEVLSDLAKNPNLEREERDLIRTTADSFTDKGDTAAVLSHLAKNPNLERDERDLIRTTADSLRGPLNTSPGLEREEQRFLLRAAADSFRGLLNTMILQSLAQNPNLEREEQGLIRQAADSWISGRRPSNKDKMFSATILAGLARSCLYKGPEDLPKVR